jgi:hypothetical protein
MLREVRQLPPTKWVRKSSNLDPDEAPSWSSITLRGPHGEDSTFLARYPLGENSPFEDTEALTHCPTIAAFIRGLPTQVYLVRLLRLRPGARIKFHTDDVVFKNSRQIIRTHLPLSTNAQCELGIGWPLHAPAPGYHVWNARLMGRFHLFPGFLWYTNVNALHSVWNEGTTDRIHLVVDLGPPPGWAP